MRLNVHKAVVEAEAHLVKIGVIDGNDDVKVVGILIAGRDVADFLAVRVLAHLLGAALVDVHAAAGQRRVVQNIRVGVRQVAGAGDGEPAVLLVQQKLPVLTVGAGGAELRRPFPVLLTVGKLLLDLAYGGVAALAEPRRELFRTVLAEIAVLELAIAEQADLLTADVAVFFIKQSHALILRFS